MNFLFRFRTSVSAEYYPTSLNWTLEMKLMEKKKSETELTAGILKKKF